MEIISRNKAFTSGLKKFFTGKSCSEGHISERYVGNGGCIECARVENAAKPAFDAWKREQREMAKRQEFESSGDFASWAEWEQKLAIMKEIERYRVEQRRENQGIKRMFKKQAMWDRSKRNKRPFELE